MSGAEVLDVGRDAIWLTIQLSLPVLLVGLAVGVGIGLLQALTQVQEATLAFLPKLVAGAVAMMFLGPFMMAVLRGYAQGIFDRMILLGGLP